MPRAHLKIGIRLPALITFALFLAVEPVHSFPGDLDPSFGNQGLVTTRFGSDRINAAFAVLAEPDGEIVAAGVEGPFDRYFAVARYDVNGDLVPTFGSGGLVVTDLPGWGSDGARAVVRQQDGKLVVVGHAAGDLALARYDPDSGALDPTFGSGGVVLTDINEGDESADAVALQPDGSIVVAGWSVQLSGQVGVIARYDAQGVLDASFGLGGMVLIGCTGSDFVHALVIQPDGKLVVGGESFSGFDQHFDFDIARYLPDGSPDDSFGVEGYARVDFARGSDRIYGLALQPDGKLVAAGSTSPRGRRDSWKPTDIALARYDTDGELDTAFGQGGRVVTDIGGGYDDARAVLIATDGRIVLAGSADRTFVVGRYLPDGSPDLEFGGCGRVTTDFPGTGFEEDQAFAVAQQSDGKLVVVGHAYNGDHGTFALARYETSGPSRCPTLPSATCKSSLKPEGSFLRIRDSSSDNLDLISWGLTSGEATTLDEFGDPLTDQEFVLCVYDGASGGGERLIFSAVTPVAQRCGRHACWTAASNRKLAFRNNGGEPCGLTAMQLTPGAGGKTKLSARGKGARLNLPPLPLNPPVHVQLHRVGGQCWQTTLTQVRQNGRGRFAARGQ